MQQKQQGFTLVEMLIAVAIVGILAAIAYPAYMDSVKKSRRTDAQTALLGLAGAMERQYTVAGAYNADTDTSGNADIDEDGNGVPDSGFYASQAPLEGNTKFYNLTFTFTATTYELIATPIGAQAGNGKLKLTSSGAQSWDEKNDGSYSAFWK